jgi:hypothetical protein
MSSFLYVLIQTGAVFVLGGFAANAVASGDTLIALICTFGWMAGAWFIWKAR